METREELSGRKRQWRAIVVGVESVGEKVMKGRTGVRERTGTTTDTRD